MGALRYKATVHALRDALVEGLVVERVHTTPVETADTGDAILAYPQRVRDETFQRGAEGAVFTLWIVAGIVGEETTLDEIDRLVGDGDTSVRAVLESGEYGGLADVISDLTVTWEGTDVGVFSGGVRYAIPRWDLEVIS